MASVRLLCRSVLVLIFSRNRARGLSPNIAASHSLSKLQILRNSVGDTDDIQSGDNDDQVVWSKNLVKSLDLKHLLSSVADHCGTRRGRQSILSLAAADDDSSQQPTRLANDIGLPYSNRRRVVDSLIVDDFDSSPSRKVETREDDCHTAKLMSVASSAEQAQEEYEMTEQALLILRDKNVLSYPPLYGHDSSPWDIKVADTDYDEWLTMPVDEWTLEHILQAEKVVDTLLQVEKWAQDNVTRMLVPGLSEIGRRISRERLVPLFDEIEGTVEVVRSRSLSDPKGKSSYVFRLKTDKFPELKQLYEAEMELVASIERALVDEVRRLEGSNEVLEFQGRKVLSVPKSTTSPNLGVIRGVTETGGRCYVEPHSVVSMGDELSRTRETLHSFQDEIEQRLVKSIVRSSGAVDAGIQWMARLDVIFAKAGWGNTLNAMVPAVGQEGCIKVQGFVHPVLSEAHDGPESVVPVDLYLMGDQGSRALIISGPNGGGKSVALKSFGLVCLLCKLGLPIPSALSLTSNQRPRVDYIDNVVVELGDNQNVIHGESTWMARLNTYSSIIQRLSGSERSSFILIDELGGGTDPSAGAAVSQAILEKLLQNPMCGVVATTHSPELKALSLESPLFDCATVLLKKDPSNPENRLLPTYRLEYGLIGDSHALAAAHRCKPTLPEDVLMRAADLLSMNTSDNGGKGGGDRIAVLTRSLEQQEQESLNARVLAEQNLKDSAKCREAMLSLSEAHARQLSSLEHHLESIFQALISDASKDRVDIVGDTLDQLRVVKKKVRSSEDLLRERGLKIAPDSYKFSDGESVVIVAHGEWEGEMAEIVLSDPSTPPDALTSNEIQVRPSFSMVGDMALEELDKSIVSRLLVFKRHEIAIWDYDSVWENDNSRPPVTSANESRRKLLRVLSSLKRASDAEQVEESEPDACRRKRFISARQRKAAKAATKMKRTRKKRKKR